MDSVELSLINLSIMFTDNTIIYECGFSSPARFQAKNNVCRLYGSICSILFTYDRIFAFDMYIYELPVSE